MKVRISPRPSSIYPFVVEYKECFLDFWSDIYRCKTKEIAEEQAAVLSKRMALKPIYFENGEVINNAKS